MKITFDNPQEDFAFFWLFVWECWQHTFNYWDSCMPSVVPEDVKYKQHQSELAKGAEGWIIGVMTVLDIPYIHQELSMRAVRDAFPDAYHQAKFRWVVRSETLANVGTDG